MAFSLHVSAGARELRASMDEINEHGRKRSTTVWLFEMCLAIRQKFYEYLIVTSCRYSIFDDYTQVSRLWSGVAFNSLVY